MTKPAIDTRPNGELRLFSGVDDLVRQSLEIASPGHVSALRQLVKKPPTSKTLVDLIDAIFARVASTWDVCLTTRTKRPSSQNWRWHEPVSSIGAKNESVEVRLERKIIESSVAQGRTDWANQVPIASGIAGSYAHKRAAIDLVHKRQDRGFEFIELKIRCNTPLFAAIEIIQYGIVWLLSRRDACSLGYGDNAILASSQIRLLVLAPASYYGNLDLAVLEAGFDAGIRAVGKANGGVGLSFGFQEFDDALLESNRLSIEAALAITAERKAYKMRRSAGPNENSIR